MRTLITVGIAIVLSGPVQAQHAAHEIHSNSQVIGDRAERTTVLSEPGQGAFAALAEITSRLRADPGTDWSKIDIDALRQHLIDMDLLMTRAAPTTVRIEDGLRIDLAIDGDAGAAVARMVPAHAPVLAQETGWSSEAEYDAGRLVWTITDAKDARQIQALGFFGLMAIGDHHKAHHLALATGAGVH